MKYKTIIVDDERLARREMRQLLAEFDEIVIVGEAENLSEAADLISKEKPQVVFLDIQLSNESGFDLLEKIDGHFKLIFVTAFDSFAIRAFEINALDYLLKPVNPERLAKAISRLNEKPVLEKRETRPLEFDDRIFLEANERPFFVKVGDISHISSAGDYTEIFTVNRKRILIERPLSQWESRLPNKYFLRIHRQTIINLEEIETIQTWFKRSFQVKLKGYENLFPVSRRYSVKLREKFG